VSNLPSKVYFPGLNGLRFLAALAVVITHVELSKKLLGHGEGLWMDASERIVTNAWDAIWSGAIRWQTPFVSAAGPHGVVFFFVLSGFLITYLLLEEKKVSGTIAIKKFYIRRILRIWPLYYLIVFLGFFVLPHISWWDIPKQEEFFMQHFMVNFLCYLFLLPNLAVAIYDRSAPNIGQAWSIGVEEQFYIIWPLLMKSFRNTWAMMVGFFICILFIKAVFVLFANPTNPNMQILGRFLATTKIESMAFGGLGAYILFYGKEKILQICYLPMMQIASFLSVPIVVLFMPKAYINLAHLVYGFAFLIIILNVAANPQSILKFKGKIIDYLGKISYGIYMYHLLSITCAIHILEFVSDCSKKLTFWQSGFVYLLSIALTIILASISYEYLEKRFIRRKEKFTTIISGEQAKE
jgi:peptidoglycan/LPS O-acetylase OafA/YrhL